MRRPPTAFHNIQEDDELVQLELSSNDDYPITSLNRIDKSLRRKIVLALKVIAVVVFGVFPVISSITLFALVSQIKPITQNVSIMHNFKLTILTVLILVLLNINNNRHLNDRGIISLHRNERISSEGNKLE